MFSGFKTKVLAFENSIHHPSRRIPIKPNKKTVILSNRTITINYYASKMIISKITHYVDTIIG